MSTRSSSHQDEIETLVHRLTGALRRRRWQWLVFFVVVFMAVHVAGFLWPATYVARAAILIEMARSRVPVDADPNDPTTVLTGAVSEEEVMSEIAILTSHEVLEKTVEATGIDQAPMPWYLRLIFGPARAYDRWYASYHDLPEPSPRDRAIHGLTQSLSATRLKDSNVLLVTFESGDPEVAEIVLDNLLEHYLDHHVEVHQPYAAGPFFTDQADRSATDLREQEDRLQQLKEEAGVADIVAEREVQLHHDAQLRLEAATLARRRAELRGQIDSLNADWSTGLDTSSNRPLMRSPTLDKLKAEVRELEGERIRLETRYNDDFPLVVENRRKLELTRSALVEERGNAAEMSPTLLEIERQLSQTRADLAGAVERSKVVSNQQRRSRGRLLNLDRQALAAARSERMIAAAEKRYLFYLERGEEARIEKALDLGKVTNVSIVQRAVALTKPVRPKKTVLLMVSILGGMLLALLAVLMLELRALGWAGVLRSAVPTEDREELEV